MADQLVFARILVEAEEQHRLTLDHHRQLVQTWFDEFPTADKQQLAEWLTTLEWDTCAALSAAGRRLSKRACDERKMSSAQLPYRSGGADFCM